MSQQYDFAVSGQQYSVLHQEKYCQQVKGGDILLYSTMVRSHVEYVSISKQCQYKRDIDKQEQVQ